MAAPRPPPAAGLPDPLAEDFRYVPGVCAEVSLDALVAEVAWEDHDFSIFGRVVRMPRRIAWQGPVPYDYSGVHHPPAPITPTVRSIHAAVQAHLGEAYNCVLLNLYRDGQDSMGWHHDADYACGDQPCIASVSLGAARRFLVRSRTGPARAAMVLEHGSLLWMGPLAQARWRHAVPKTRQPVGPRVNLTFRFVAG